MAAALNPQNGLYTLITRSIDGDSFELVGTVSAVHATAEHDAYLDYLSRPEVAIVTITVTEAGYSGLRAGDGTSTATRSNVILKRSGWIRDGDNLPENGAVTQEVVRDLAALVDGSLTDWIETNIDFATSMVDRITPAATDDDRKLVEEACGYVDARFVGAIVFHCHILAHEDNGMMGIIDITKDGRLSEATQQTSTRCIARWLANTWATWAPLATPSRLSDPDRRNLRSRTFLTVCIGSNLCRRPATYVYVGFVNGRLGRHSAISCCHDDLAGIVVAVFRRRE